MKRKLIISTIFVGMMVALSGTAAAFNLGIDGGGLISIAPGTSKTLDLTASNFNSLNTEYTLDTLAVQCSGANTPPYDTNCRADLITVTVNTNTFTPNSNIFSLPGAVTIANDLNNNDPAGTKYIINLQSNSGETGGFAVATAFNLAIDKPGLVKLDPGQSATLDMTASGINPADFGKPITLSLFSVDCSLLNPSPYDVSCDTTGVTNGITFNGGLDLTGFIPTSNVVPLPGALTITMPSNSLDPVGTQYIISIVGSSGGSMAFPIASVDASKIPEFPTMAMPVIAAVGILLFFQNRKKKER